MTITCDTCGAATAVWYCSTPDDAPVLARSRFACDRHKAAAEAVVGDGGRRVTTTNLTADSTNGGPQ